MQHTPVLLREALELLDPKPGEVIVDVTLGLGGHAAKFLEKIGSRGKLIGIDADEKNLAEARKKLTGKNVTLIHGNFRDLPSLLSQSTITTCDILFADLGLSSPHLDDPERGFSFRTDAPLDLRFDQTHGENALELLRDSKEANLLRIFREYGELPDARPLVQIIVTGRKKHPLGRTSDLVASAEEAYGWRAQKLLPQIFQALRIAVNDEMGALTSLLEHGPLLLSQGGRMAVMSYHSLEDRMVKLRFASLAPRGAVSQYELLTPKPIKPTIEEIKANPRSRSAKLRFLQKK